VRVKHDLKKLYSTVMNHVGLIYLAKNQPKLKLYIYIYIYIARFFSYEERLVSSNYSFIFEVEKVEPSVDRSVI